jgi:DNA-directed RNA polymerase alpha subunit
VIFKNLFQVSLNPELVICNLDSKTELRFNYRKGRGYVPAEENKNKMLQLELFLQILFLLGKNVKYAMKTSV